jgi:hypothetical protein
MTEYTQQLIAATLASAKVRPLEVGLETAVFEQASEIDRLTGALKRANSQAEHFEREWYLRGDALEAQAAELATLRADAERWRYWRNFWPALCRMEVARFARLDLSRKHVQSPADMDEVTDAARNTLESTNG